MGIEEFNLEQERKAAEKKGLLKGEKRGEKTGELKKTIQIILAGFDDGLPIPQISRITKMPEQEVLKILKEEGRV